MKKLFAFLVYAITLATPAMIVQYYHHFVKAMSPEEIKMSTIVGTGATLLMAMIYGFGTRRPKTFNAARVKNARIAGNGEIIVKDPGAHGAETLFKWNEKSGLWESDHGTYLDQEHMDEWLKQRGDDRKFANEEMRKLKNRETAFDRDIDALGKKKKR